MIPLRDDIRSSRFPIVTVSLIVINVLVFLYQLYLESMGLQDQFILTWATVPYDVIHNLNTHTILTLFASMFMHGGWLHIAGNMLYL